MEREGFIAADPRGLMQFLKERRIRQGFTQWDVAEAVGTQQSAIHDWDRGAGITLENTMIYASALGFRVALIPFSYEGDAEDELA